ncbi:pupal cuticle protein 27 [Zeugodacus cucurbitae]|uniref:Larval cuticle protein 1 n=1 Tax=Zeugodacus cucurbitae TaxID=28588 RepID=A0A0A1X0X9_ZEUCU|nr:pupal cuticle protein 27 [Zeugodacus cucurbitae]
MKRQIVSIILYEYVLFSKVLSLATPSLKYLPPGNIGVPSRQYLQYKIVKEAPYGVAYERGTNSGRTKYVATKQIPIVRQDYASDSSGNYNFGFETANGIQRAESGDVQGKPKSSLNVKGSYSYIGDDGRTYTINYRADENGFHAEGVHLPTPPPFYGQSHIGGTFSGGGSQNKVNVYSPSIQYLPPQRLVSKRH